MMKNYLELIPISAKVHKKHNRMTILCIALAVFLVTAIFSMADMELRSQKIRAILNYGNWHIQIRNISESDAALIADRPDVEASSWYDVLNYRLKDAYGINGKRVAICGIERPLVENLWAESGSIVEGRYPENDREVILTQNAKDIFKKEIGDTVTLMLPSKDTMDFIISGFGMNTAMISKFDAVGVFMTLDGFEQLYEAAEGDEPADSDFVYYVRFRENCNIRKSIQNMKEQYHLTDENIGQNTALLGIMGFSDDSYMLGLYGTAGVLFLLVLTAGILMIASSMNSNIAERTEFFGMLRCVGAGRKQIMRIVRLEALHWCKKAIPLGAAAGAAITWVLCAVLRLLSANYFSDLPVFGISLPGIVSGVVVGLLTVLLAARAPAKKAARVSPLAAVSGSGEISPNNIRRATHTSLLKLDTALGVSHAGRSKKNFLLMVGSFTLSVILFLTFSTVVDFMHHAITSFSPYTPDISIVSPDNTRSVDRKLAEELAQREEVKHVYGRMFAYDVPVMFGSEEKKINLISYESTQFQWAEQEGDILEGDISKVVREENYVLTVYHSENPLKTGDKIQTEFGELTVAGVLSDCPFDRNKGTETVICSEDTFQKLLGKNDYTIIDIQLTGGATDEDVNAIRDLAGESVIFSDERLENREARGAYYAFTLFVYGFLAVIAMITVFNIMNSISMSVSARIRQYGAMRAIGMSIRQLTRMVAAEAVTYAVCGSAAGCVLGLPIHRFLYETLVTARWGDAWTVPVPAMAVIVLLVLLASAAAVYAPSKRIKNMSVTDTIHAQ